MATAPEEFIRGRDVDYIFHCWYASASTMPNIMPGISIKQTTGGASEVKRTGQSDG